MGVQTSDKKIKDVGYKWRYHKDDKSLKTWPYKAGRVLRSRRRSAIYRDISRVSYDYPNTYRD